MGLEEHHEEDGFEINRGRQLHTVRDLLQYTGSPREDAAGGYGSKLIVIKPKDEANSYIGRVRQEPNSWGIYIFAYYSDETGKNIRRNLIPKVADMDSTHPSLEHYPPSDREQVMLATGLEDEIYEYRKAA